MVVLQVFQAQLLSSMDESEPNPANSQGAEKCYRPGTARHQDHRPGDRQVHDQPSGARAPPVAHTDGDQGCRKGSLPWEFFPSGLFGPVVEGFSEHFTEAQKPLCSLLSPHSAPGAVGDMFVPKIVTVQAPKQPARCYSGKNKTQTFSEREQTSSSMPHKCPAPVQSATRVYPTPRHTKPIYL